MAAFALTLLYVLGALATFSSFLHAGYWREEKREERWLLCILVPFWPIFTLCLTYTVVRGILRHKAQRAAIAAKADQQGGDKQ